MVDYYINSEDLLGDCYYLTSISCSNYNPLIDSSVTVTVTLKNVYGSPLVGESVEVAASAGVFTHLDDVSIDSSSSVTGTTNSDGQFALTYSCSQWGLITFTANDTTIQVNVDGWRTTNGSLTGSWALQRNKNFAKFLLLGWSASASSSFTNFGTGTYASAVRPRTTVWARGDKDDIDFTIKSDGSIEYRNTGTTRNVYMQTMWAIRDEDL